MNNIFGQYVLDHKRKMREGKKMVIKEETRKINVKPKAERREEKNSKERQKVNVA